MTYVRDLSFEATPNYEYLKKLFLSMISKKGWDKEEVFDYDWFIKREDLIEIMCVDETVLIQRQKSDDSLDDCDSYNEDGEL